MPFLFRICILRANNTVVSPISCWRKIRSLVFREEQKFKSAGGHGTEENIWVLGGGSSMQFNKITVKSFIICILGSLSLGWRNRGMHRTCTVYGRDGKVRADSGVVGILAPGASDQNGRPWIAKLNTHVTVIYWLLVGLSNQKFVELSGFYSKHLFFRLLDSAVRGDRNILAQISGGKSWSEEA